ncbi:MAG: bifunctional UDP-N-acetylglucosamine diphosphorylase/glucosamine-1-phosphate N-acetyltransferase GlmU [Actinomycetales bacterium]
MSPVRPTAAVILAAGEGTRMKSTLPKVMHPLAGRSMLAHAIEAAEATMPQHLVVVVRHRREQVAEHVAQVAPRAVIADQDEVPGTGRAVQCGLQALAESDPQSGPTSGTVLVTYGDVPLLDGATLSGLLEAHQEQGNAVTVITSTPPDPTGYGRVVRAEDGTVAAIVEHKDATAEQLLIGEINSGLYAFDAEVLADALTRVGAANAQGEVYLTDVLAIARQDGHRVAAYPVADRWQTEGVNDRVQLAAMGRVLNERIVQAHQRAGVTVVDPATTWIDDTVQIATDVTLLPGTHLSGACSVAGFAVIGPDTTLVDCTIGERAQVVRSHAIGAQIGPGASVGPFSYLRPGTRLESGGKIGAFVETKNSSIGVGSKVPHLSYVGDATIGEGVNIGAATVFVNYDGVNKHSTVVEDHARVGSDSMLVAPVRIGTGAYTAAGSVITDDVPAGAMGVGRAKQRNIIGWVQRRRAGSDAATAAAATTEPGPAAAAEGDSQEGSR